jgi:hypothetical protein
MAKSSRVSVSSGSGTSLNKLRSFCTAAERKLLDMSESSGLSKAAHAEVQALLVRARATRDKWRGLVGHQTRVVKRSPKAVAEANARSHAKAELFDGAVKRFEAHLKTLASTVTGAVESAVKSLTGRTKTPKRARVTGNRASRAGLRKEFSRQVESLNRVASKPATAKAKPVAAVARAVPVSKAAPVAAPVVAKAAAVPVAGKAAATSKKRKLAPAKAAVQAVRFDVAKQRSARTSAKNSRLKMEGLATRRAGHTIASGKRSQARRDKRR